MFVHFFSIPTFFHFLNFLYDWFILFFLLNFILQTFNSFRNTIFINHNHNYTNIIFINKSSGHKYIMPLTNINYLLKHATLSIVPHYRSNTIFYHYSFCIFSNCLFFIWLPSNFNNYFMNNNRINLGAKSLIIVNS